MFQKIGKRKKRLERGDTWEYLFQENANEHKRTWLLSPKELKQREPGDFPGYRVRSAHCAGLGKYFWWLMSKCLQNDLPALREKQAQSLEKPIRIWTNHPETILHLVTEVWLHKIRDLQLLGFFLDPPITKLGQITELLSQLFFHVNDWWSCTWLRRWLQKFNDFRHRLLRGWVCTK